MPGVSTYRIVQNCEATSNTGKTTLVNALLNLIPLSERLLIIEDAGEIQARAGNVVRRFATNGADLKRHVFESLRDRPDRIIIGEVRGSEARDMLEAAATGHAGGLSTIHANSCDEALTRLARLAMRSAIHPRGHRCGGVH